MNGEEEFCAFFVARCKGTMNIWGFANFLARKCKKSAFLWNFGQKMMIIWNG
jgi:hypothetical protein